MKINKDLSNVIVMANQPTDKRQIWLQRSDNLYDGQITNLLVGETKSFTLTLKPNTNYTLSSNIPLDQTSALLFIATGTSAQGASTFNNGVWLGQNRTMPTDTNGKITIAYRRLSNDIPSLASFNYKLEEGSSMLKDKIYVLNENNTYDEFYPNFLNFYATGDQGSYKLEDNKYLDVKGMTILDNYNRYKTLDRYILLKNMILELTATDDLNDLRGYGWFSWGVGVHPLNSPRDGCTMLVLPHNWGCIQICTYYSKTDMNIYIRKKTNFESEWSSWLKIAPVSM